jgi:type II secretory pathway component PulL
MGMCAIRQTLGDSRLFLYKEIRPQMTRAIKPSTPSLNFLSGDKHDMKQNSRQWKVWRVNEEKRGKV